MLGDRQQLVRGSPARTRSVMIAPRLAQAGFPAQIVEPEHQVGVVVVGRVLDHRAPGTGHRNAGHRLSSGSTCLGGRRPAPAEDPRRQLQQLVAGLVQNLVERRDRHQRQHRRGDDPADDRDAERGAELGRPRRCPARPAACRRSARRSSSGSAGAGSRPPRSAPRAAGARPARGPTWRSRSAGSRSWPRSPSAGSPRSGS